jgi:hypothetical protein
MNGLKIDDGAGLGSGVHSANPVLSHVGKTDLQAAQRRTSARN